ncbi:MAG: O-antigen ligase family protein [Deltaproteobacteria bacterium]|nr:O-antigen ligase family protein [Deltaproteobacteria bacterium]
MEPRNNYRFLFVWLAVWINTAALLVGSVHYTTQVIIAIGGLLTFFTTSFCYIKNGHRRTKKFYITGALSVYLLITLWLFIQIIPLPPGLIKSISPYMYEAMSRIGDISWHPISYEPSHTFIEAVKYLGYAGFIWGIYLYSRKVSGGSKRLLYVTAFFGVTLSIVAFFHLAAGYKSIFGIYFPKDSSSFMVPFVNSNHASAYYSFIFFITIGLAMEESAFRLKIFTYTLAPLPLIAVLYTGSRGGILSLVVGGILFFWFYKSKITKSDSSSAPYVIALVVMFAMIPLLDRFVLPFIESQTPLKDAKFILLKDVFSMASSHITAGIGKGSFITVFPHFQQSVTGLDIHYAENFILQMIVDFGPGFSLFILLVSGYFAFRCITFMRFNNARIGLISATGALLFQNLFDFNLEFPGTGMLLVLAMGIFSSIRLNSRQRSFRLGIPLKTFIIVMVFLMLPITYGVFSDFNSDVISHRAKLIETFRAGDNKKLLSLSRKYSKLHIVDYYSAAVRGYAETYEKNGQPLKWLGLSSWYNPTHFLPELMAARLLYNYGNKSQSKLQYSRAFGKGFSITGRFMNELRLRFANPDTWLDFIPENQFGRLYSLSSEPERMSLCKRLIALKNYSFEQCNRRNAMEYFNSGDWESLLKHTNNWQKNYKDTNRDIIYYTLRALFEIHNNSEFENRLRISIKQFPKEGVFVTTWILCSDYKKSRQQKIDLISKLVEKPYLKASHKYYCYYALSMLAKDDALKSKYLNQMKRRRRLHKRDSSVEKILLPVWEECID